MRSSVVLPDPDGPSSAISSPCGTLRSTWSSAAKAPNFFTILRTSMVTRSLSFVEMPLENGLHHQGDQRQHGQQRSDRERRYELICVVEYFNQQRHGVGLAADVTGDDGHRAEFAHRTGVAKQHAIQQPPLDVRQRDARQRKQKLDVVVLQPRPKKTLPAEQQDKQQTGNDRTHREWQIDQR